MTLKIVLNNTDEFSSWWNVWLSHLVLLVKLALKNRTYNTIKFETQNQRVHHSTKGNCLLIGNYQYSLHCGHWWASYELIYVQIRAFVYWVRGVMFLYGWIEGWKFQSLKKTTWSGQIQSNKNGTTGPLHILFSEI